MRVLIVSMLLMLGGCGIVAQTLRVDPQVSVAASDIGKGKKVGVLVLDERLIKDIGTRDISGSGAKIDTEQDLAQVLKIPILDGLQKKGFQPTEENESGSSVRIELQTLEFGVSENIWAGAYRINNRNIAGATLKVIAKNLPGQDYEKTYKGEMEIRTAFDSSQVTNSKVINGAVNSALENLFSDEELFNFLAR